MFNRFQFRIDTHRRDNCSRGAAESLVDRADVHVHVRGVVLHFATMSDGTGKFPWTVPSRHFAIRIHFSRKGVARKHKTIRPRSFTKTFTKTVPSTKRNDDTGFTVADSLARSGAPPLRETTPSLSKSSTAKSSPRFRQRSARANRPRLSKIAASRLRTYDANVDAKNRQGAREQWRRSDAGQLHAVASATSAPSYLRPTTDAIFRRVSAAPHSRTSRTCPARTPHTRETRFRDRNALDPAKFEEKLRDDEARDSPCNDADAD